MDKPEPEANDDGGNDPAGSESSVVDDILNREPDTLFRDKDLVDPSTIVDQDRIYGRDKQLAEEALAYRDSLRGNRPPDLLLYGPSGTGKSLTIKSVINKVQERAENNGITFDYASVNFKTMESHTLDRAVWKLGKETAMKAGIEWEIPRKGRSTSVKMSKLYEIVDNHFDMFVFILDELDTLTETNSEGEKAYSRLLYSLSRAMDEQHVETLISTVTITNYLKFQKRLESRTHSSYNPTRIHFPDYDADELTKILDRRRDAFKENVLEEGVIDLVAQYGADNEGDARRAIDLLRDAGETADKTGDTKVRAQHVHSARDSVVKNIVHQVISKMSPQKQLSLYAAALVADVSENGAPSPIVYKAYKQLCEKTDSEIYTDEIVNKHISKADTYGILDKERTGGGYGSGVHLRFTFTEPVHAVLETLQETDLISGIKTEDIQMMAAEQLEEHY